MNEQQEMEINLPLGTVDMVDALTDHSVFLRQFRSKWSEFYFE